MNEKEKRAVWFKHNGRRSNLFALLAKNCCQSVTEALTENDMPEGVSPDALNRLASGFRTGMGGMEATCGALCGAVMVAGLRTGGMEAGKLAKVMHQRFTELSGASICKVLKSRGADGKIVCEPMEQREQSEACFISAESRQRSNIVQCDDCVRHAVRVYQETMQ